jgi:hypothetical protein
MAGSVWQVRAQQMMISFPFAFLSFLPAPAAFAAFFFVLFFLHVAVFVKVRAASSG